jgi:hypothetical protein
MQGYNEAAIEMLDGVWESDSTPFDNLLSFAVITVDEEQENYQVGHQTVPVDTYAAKALICQAKLGDKPLNKQIVGLPIVQDYLPHLKHSQEPLNSVEEVVIKEFIKASQVHYPGSYRELPFPRAIVLEKMPDKAENLFEIGESKTLYVSSMFPKPSQFAALSEHLIETGYSLPINLMRIDILSLTQVNWDQEVRQELGEENELLGRSKGGNPITANSKPHGGRGGLQQKSSRQKFDASPGQGFRYNGKAVRKKYEPLISGGSYNVASLMDPEKLEGRVSRLGRSNNNLFWKEGISTFPGEIAVEIKQAVLHSEENKVVSARQAMYYLATIIESAGITWTNLELGEVNPLEMAIMVFVARYSWKNVWKGGRRKYVFNMT